MVVSLASQSAPSMHNEHRRDLHVPKRAHGPQGQPRGHHDRPEDLDHLDHTPRPQYATATSCVMPLDGPAIERTVSVPARC